MSCVERKRIILERTSGKYYQGVFYLFTCDLFDSIFSISCCIASNGGVI
jgi:hypothetical protein